MQFLLLVFILVPIIEIGVFIQLGSFLGLGVTLLIVFVTAVLGVTLLKQQGLRAWQDIQKITAQGKTPVLEMASAAQLLFAGGLLLTPGFVTDGIGLTLMLPAVRLIIAKKLVHRWSLHVSPPQNNFADFQVYTQNTPPDNDIKRKDNGRTVEGEFEDHSQK